MSITTLEEGRYVDINASALAATGLARDQVIGRTVRDLGFYNDAEHYRRVRDLLTTSGQFTDLETTLRGRRGPQTYLLSGALVDLRGEPCVLTSAVDITERKQSEEHIRFLMNEINHRANNLLAVVQALVRQMANTADSKPFAERLSQRIQGIAASNNLLVSGEWQGVEVTKLIASQLSHFTDFSSRVAVEGPSVRLTPAATQAVGMALHELATNAAKYGALSNETGSIRVDWAVAGPDDERTFRMCWTERGGPPVTAPLRTGFGHTVTERMIEGALGGKARIEFAADGVVWSFACPAHRALDSDS